MRQHEFKVCAGVNMSRHQMYVWISEDVLCLSVPVGSVKVFNIGVSLCTCMCMFVRPRTRACECVCVCVRRISVRVCTCVPECGRSVVRWKECEYMYVCCCHGMCVYVCMCMCVCVTHCVRVVAGVRAYICVVLTVARRFVTYFPVQYSYQNISASVKL